ncbi:DUF2690 domain-containing protein [Kitasatospora sp. NPDC094011]|uniref:DUF2690 domain-containing protein n=1 Tax=Kitasatospora sp. NPDC094011 TaxID=3364090 RepID=UPI0038122EE8
MKLSLRTAASAASTLALVASGLLFASGTASAATSCYASSCTGLDPASTICQNDAVTVRYTAPDGDAELRYSPTCRAAWARASGAGRVPATIQVENTQGASYTVVNTGDHTVYTRMVNDKDIQARASFHYANNTQYGYSEWY